MKSKSAKRMVTADAAVAEASLPREIIIVRRRPAELPVALPLNQQQGSQGKGAEPKAAAQQALDKGVKDTAGAKKLAGVK